MFETKNPASEGRSRSLALMGHLGRGAGGTFCFAQPVVLVPCRLTVHPAVSLEVALLLPRSQCVLPTGFYFTNFQKP